jgi:hypothetical protein
VPVFLVATFGVQGFDRRKVSTRSRTRWVVGVTVQVDLWGMSATFSTGFVGDNSGNLGWAVTGGIGQGEGEAVSAGITGQASNAANIGDLQGPFGDFSAGVGAGEAVGGEYFAGNSPDGFVNGVGASYGVGFGVGASYSVTSTFVVPIGKF